MGTGCSEKGRELLLAIQFMFTHGVFYSVIYVVLSLIATQSDFTDNIESFIPFHSILMNVCFLFNSHY